MAKIERAQGRNCVPSLPLGDEFYVCNVHFNRRNTPHQLEQHAHALTAARLPLQNSFQAGKRPMYDLYG